MNTEQIKQEILESAFCEVLERMAFMFGEAADKEELTTYYQDYLRAGISFIGDAAGELNIVVPEEMCRELSANILGQDPGGDMAKQYAVDALMELLNVTCGQFLLAVAGEKPVFNLSPPHICRLGLPSWQAMIKNLSASAFWVDDYPVLLELVWEGRPQ